MSGRWETVDDVRPDGGEEMSAKTDWADCDDRVRWRNNNGRHGSLARGRRKKTATRRLEEEDFLEMEMKRWR